MGSGGLRSRAEVSLGCALVQEANTALLLSRRLCMQMFPRDLSRSICHHIVEGRPVIGPHVGSIVALGVTVMEGDLRVSGAMAFGEAAVAFRPLASVVNHEKRELAATRMGQKAHLQRSTPTARERIRVLKVCLLRRFHLHR